MVSERASQQAFFGVSALLFAASAAVTIVWCASMSAMGEMPMPGGWTMSMAWMLMPGQTWPGAAASFLGMWVVMMVAMMLPSLVPMLWRYRQAVGRTGETRLGRLTALVGAGYFLVWNVFGMAIFPLGVAPRRWRCRPVYEHCDVLTQKLQGLDGRPCIPTVFAAFLTLGIVISTACMERATTTTSDLPLFEPGANLNISEQAGATGAKLFEHVAVGSCGFRPGATGCRMEPIQGT